MIALAQHGCSPCDMASIAIDLAGSITIEEPDDKPNPLHHMKLVWSIAIAHHGCGRRRGLDLEDLVQSGHIGLLRACERFRTELGYEFSTYATYWIKHFIGRALQNAHGPLRVPVGILDLMSAVRRGKVATDTLTKNQKSRIAIAERVLGSAAVHDPAVLADVVADRNRDDGPDEDAEFARSLLAILPAREREVLTAHFGIGGEPLALAAVAVQSGLSRQRVRTLYGRGLDRIRRYLTAQGLVEVECYRPARSRAPYGSKSPVRGVHITPEGNFGVKISIGGGRVARGGTFATLDEAKAAANALALQLLGMENYAVPRERP